MCPHLGYVARVLLAFSLSAPMSAPNVFSNLSEGQCSVVHVNRGRQKYRNTSSGIPVADPSWARVRGVWPRQTRGGRGGRRNWGRGAVRQRRDFDWTMTRTMTFRRETYLFLLKKLIVLAIVQSESIDCVSQLSHLTQFP